MTESRLKEIEKEMGDSIYPGINITHPSVIELIAEVRHLKKEKLELTIAPLTHEQKLKQENQALRELLREAKNYIPNTRHPLLLALLERIDTALDKK